MGPERDTLSTSAACLVQLWDRFSFDASLPMKTINVIAILVTFLSFTLEAKEAPMANPMIDYQGFLENASTVGKTTQGASHF
jgi:hypothetical protein